MSVLQKVTRNSEFFRYELVTYTHRTERVHWKNKRGREMSWSWCLWRRKGRNLRFWFYPILVRRQRRGEFHGLIPELKLSYISQHVSGAILLLLGQHLTTQKSFHRADWLRDVQLCLSQSTIILPRLYSVPVRALRYECQMQWRDWSDVFMQ